MDRQAEKDGRASRPVLDRAVRPNREPEIAGELVPVDFLIEAAGAYFAGIGYCLMGIAYVFGWRTDRMPRPAKPTKDLW
jgi:hypothetical protein